MNLSSLVVDAHPSHAGAVGAALRQWPGVEVQAATGQGKLIVTVEADSDVQTAEIFARINALDGVMSASMVYHQYEPEPEQEVSP
ncbi:MAG: chaperone NapD [Burkholderiaceae bacterium]|jgi:nitrate reductase NapD|nr:chaperone NapD [Burkholderiaceae bacterium]